MTEIEMNCRILKANGFFEVTARVIWDAAIVSTKGNP